MEFKIDIKGLNEIVKELDDLAKKQLPFAIARSLTMTASDARKKIIQEMPMRFTIRTGWLTSKYGPRVEMATKQNMSAKVFITAPWIIGFEKGEIRTPEGKFFTIPTENVRRTKRDLIAKTMKPSYLLHQAKRKAFFVNTKVGLKVIAQRVSKKRYPLKIMYYLVPKAKITPRLFFEQTCRGIVYENWRKNFDIALDEAIRTAK